MSEVTRALHAVLKAKLAKIRAELEIQKGRYPAGTAGGKGGQFAPTGSASAGSGGKDGEDFLTTLFGGGGSSSAPAPRAAPAQFDGSQLVRPLKEFAAKKEAEAAQWEAKVYKPNRGKAYLQGDGPSRSEALTIGSINEGRRRRNIEAALTQANAAKRLVESISNGSDISAAIKTAISYADQEIRSNRGLGPHKSRDEKIEGFISMKLLGDNYRSYGPKSVAHVIRTEWDKQSVRKNLEERIDALLKAVNRYPAGSSKGGQFAPKGVVGGGGSSASSKRPRTFAGRPAPKGGGSAAPEKQPEAKKPEALAQKPIENKPIEVQRIFDELQKNPNFSKLDNSNQKLLMERYMVAAKEHPAFEKDLLTVSSANGGYASFPPIKDQLEGTGPLKGTDRALSKIVSEYKGDASKIGDLLRATVVVTSVDGAKQVIDHIKGSYKVHENRSRNLLDDSVPAMEGGYRDAKFIVETKGGVLAEIQVNVPEMMDAKHESHHIYVKREEWRRSRNLDSDQFKSWGPEDQKVWYDFNAQQSAYYEPAWSSFLNRSKSFKKSGSRISYPFLIAESNGNSRGGVSSQATQPGASGCPTVTGSPSTLKKSACSAGVGFGISVIPPDQSVSQGEQRLEKFRLDGAVVKAAGHWPAGAPGGKGGQFAPKGVSGVGVERTPSRRPRSQEKPNKNAAPMPDFRAARLPDSNKNAGTHNAKIALIEGFANQGNSNGILGMRFGTNTYSKQQVKVANGALAALGSVHRVALGQLAGSHIGLQRAGAVTAPVVQPPEPPPPPPPPPPPAPPVSEFQRVMDAFDAKRSQTKVTEISDSARQRVIKVLQDSGLPGLGDADTALSGGRKNMYERVMWVSGRTVDAVHAALTTPSDVLNSVFASGFRSMTLEQVTNATVELHVAAAHYSIDKAISKATDGLKPEDSAAVTAQKLELIKSSAMADINRFKEAAAYGEGHGRDHLWDEVNSRAASLSQMTAENAFVRKNPDFFPDSWVDEILPSGVLPAHKPHVPWEEAATIDEAVSKLKSNYGTEAIDSHRTSTPYSTYSWATALPPAAHLGVLNDSARAIASLNERFPGVTEMTRFVYDVKPSRAWGVAPGNSIVVSPKSVYANNVGMYANISARQPAKIPFSMTSYEYENGRVYGADEEGKRKAVIKCAESTYRHETGHAIGSALGRIPEDKLFAMKIRSPQTRRPIAAKTWAKTQFTQYSGKNKLELFAEVFSKYTHPEYRAGELPAEIEEFMRKTIIKAQVMAARKRTTVTKAKASKDELEVLIDPPPPPPGYELLEQDNYDSEDKFVYIAPDGGTVTLKDLYESGYFD